MCAKFGCGPTVVSKKGGGGTDRQTDRQADRQTKISATLYSRCGRNVCLRVSVCASYVHANVYAYVCVGARAYATARV